MPIAMQSPLFGLIPFVLLLSLSFFILVVVGNVKTQALKIFGYVIVALCWVAALLIFSTCVCKQMRKTCPMMPMRQNMMGQAKGTMEEPIAPKAPGCPKMQSK
ncbi:MAG: hypothetical protein WCY05_05805 [Candidatus Omnitrophota bacterium]